MAKVQVKAKPKPESSRLRQIAIVTFAAVLFHKTQRASCEGSSSATETYSSTGPPSSPICPEYCNLPPDAATRSKAPFPRWYYDPEEGACKRFRWGGRGGNKNRFFRREHCEEVCSKCSSIDPVNNNQYQNQKAEANDGTDKGPDNICTLPVNDGQCALKDSKIPNKPQLVWHFDSEKERCSPFIFYGCGGNNNRFFTKVDCEEICQ